jgi:hypothetical protein
MDYFFISLPETAKPPTENRGKFGRLLKDSPSIISV